MKKLTMARIIVTYVAIISALVVAMISLTGINTAFTDGMLLAMKVIGGISIAAFIVNAVFALIPVIQLRNG